VTRTLASPLAMVNKTKHTGVSQIYIVLSLA